jgi:hypothetical protein
MSVRPAAALKRPLCEALDAGLERDEPHHPGLGARALYDVLDGGGVLCGSCLQTLDGKFVYTEPPHLRGREVAVPMRVSRHVNSAQLAETLGRVLSVQVLAGP